MINPRSTPSRILSLCLSVLAILLLTAGSNCGIAQAELKLASLFTDHAVLQQDQAIPIWGTADAEAHVTVKFGEQNKTTVADSEGNWKVVLDAMPANANPRPLQIADADSKISLADIVVGEVWICSGQSNMQMEYKQVPKVRALKSSAKNLRVFKVKNTVAFTQQSSCQGQWKIQPPASAVAFAFAYHLEQHANVPIGIIQTSWGSSSIEAWMPRDMTETVPHFKTIMEEFDADDKTRQRITSILNMPEGWKRQDDVFLRRQPNVLYNAMMHPLAPYGCRGLVWYQGERNTQSMFGMVKSPWFGRHSGMLKYGQTLQAWIKRYRKQWRNDEMHFMIVMLPGYYKPGKPEPGLEASDLGAEHPASHSWAWMRESQLAALDLSHTSVANTIDLGDVKNVHPKDKLPIGKRLALLAAKDALGQDVKAAGPMLKQVDVEGEQLVVHFDHAEGLTTTDQNKPTGFWLADDSEQWVPAEAEIKDQSVVLRSNELKSPLYVRYAFAGKPQVNLVNAAELPAHPFRTDKFAP